MAQVCCASCLEAKSVGVKSSWHGYVSDKAPRHAMRFVLARLLTGAALKAFRCRLRKRLDGDPSSEIAALEARLARLTRASERLARELREVDSEDEVLAREYRIARNERTETEGRLHQARQRLTKPLRAAIERQLAVDPLTVLDRLLEDPPDPAAAQSVLGRLFPRIVLVARPRKFESVWELTLAPGVCFAEASGTEIVERNPVTLRVRVTCGAKRPSVWHVEEV